MFAYSFNGLIFSLHDGEHGGTQVGSGAGEVLESYILIKGSRQRERHT